MVKLKVPYHTQHNNSRNPGGSCNVTCLAMVCRYLFPKRNFGCPKGRQLEDYFYDRMEEENLSRHDPSDLQAYLHSLDVPDYFTTKGTIKDVQSHLDSNRPCIIHGWFTTSGHIVTVIGYDNAGLYIHDPWGEYPYTTDGSGEGVHYNYELIKQLCMADGDLWAHYVGKQHAFNAA